jgi:DNA polymerase
MTLKELEKSASKCKACSLHADRKQSVFAKGDPTADIVICGMAPAKDEVEVGIPFVGRSGKLLDQVLDAAGIDNYYITNLVKCYVPAGTKLEEKCMDMCSLYYLLEVHNVKPKVLVYLGSDVSTYMDREKRKFKDKRGKVIVDGTYSTITTYHPSYVVRTGGDKSRHWDIIVEDFKKARSLI